MPNGTYGGVRGKETEVGQKTFVSRPTRFAHPAECSGFRHTSVSPHDREPNDSRLPELVSELPAFQYFAALCRQNYEGSGFMAPPLGPTFGKSTLIFNII